MRDKFHKARLQILRDILLPERLTHIVDVGANPIEVPSYKRLHDEGQAVIIGFEPQKEAYDKLTDQQSETEVYLPYAVGNGRIAELKCTNNDGFTSLLEPRDATYNFFGQFWRATRVRDRVKLKTKKLDTIKEIKHLDMLKIDIQGGEVDVFKHASKKLKNAVAVITEVAFYPLYENQPLIGDQMRALSEHGFSLHKFIFAKTLLLRRNSSRRLNGKNHASQLVDGDAVFIRDFSDPEVYSNEQLKHLALLADSAFSSYDLSLVCLEELIKRGVINAGKLDIYIDHIPMIEPK